MPALGAVSHQKKMNFSCGLPLRSHPSAMQPSRTVKLWQAAAILDPWLVTPSSRVYALRSHPAPRAYSTPQVSQKFGQNSPPLCLTYVWK